MKATYSEDGECNEVKVLATTKNTCKVTLEQTFIEMAASQEEWDDFDALSNDGLNKLVW